MSSEMDELRARVELIEFACQEQILKAEQARGHARASIEDRKRRRADGEKWKTKLGEFLESECVAVDIPDFDAPRPRNVPGPNRDENALHFDDLHHAFVKSDGHGRSPLGTMTSGDVAGVVTQFAERHGGRRATGTRGVAWFGIALRNSKLGRQATAATEAPALAG